MLECILLFVSINIVNIGRKSDNAICNLPIKSYKEIHMQPRIANHDEFSMCMSKSFRFDILAFLNLRIRL